MKAGIITHYDVHNHGAHLQLYALTQQLKAFGYDAKALRFQKNYDFMGGAEVGKKYNISLRSIPTYVKYLIENGLDRTLYNIKKRNMLGAFRQTHDLVGDYYSEAIDLDVVVIGSDEIFSVEAGPNPWYYGIGIPCKNQISYAASFGPTTLKLIDEHNVGGLVEAGLKNIRCIGVRDQNSNDIVKYFTRKDACIVCDPVLLYDFSEFFNHDALEKFKKIRNEDYCIVYSYDYNMNDSETVRAIKAYAKSNDLKIYSVGYFHKWCDSSINVDPLDVFVWFANAKMVFTDTFHGTVLSLVTNCQFITKVRGNGNKLDYLLSQYGVSHRKTNDFNDIQEKEKHPVDYNEVNKTIENIRVKSKSFLEGAVNRDVAN